MEPAQQTSSHVHTLSQVPELTAALSANLEANGDSPGTEDCFSSLIESISIQDVKRILMEDRRSYFLAICRPALELLAEAGLLHQEELITAFKKHGPDVAATSKAETIQNAVTILQKFHSLKSPDQVLPPAIEVKVGNLFHQAAQFRPVEFVADKAYTLLLKAFRSNNKDLDSIEGLSRILLSKAEIFGVFNKEMVQELSQNIISQLGLDLESDCVSMITVDDTSRHRYCGALLDLLCAQRKEFEIRLIVADICNVSNGLRQLLRIVPKDEEWLYKVHLSTALRLRFRYTEDLEDGHESVALAAQALETAPRTPQARAACFEAKAKALNVHYEFFEAESLLDEIVTLFSKALSARLEDPSPPYLLPMALLDLASAVCFRYAKLGLSQDMEIAVCAAELALKCFPPNDHQYDVRRSLCIQALGDIHLRLHWRSSGVEQLDKAMEYYKESEEQNEPSVYSLYGTTQYNYALVQMGYRRHDQSYINKAFKRKKDWLAAHGGDGLHLSPIDNINHILVPGQAMPFLARKVPTAEERDHLIEDAIKTIELAMKQKSIAARFVYVYEALAIALHDKAAYSRQLTDYEKSLQHFRRSSEVFTEEQLTNHLRIKLNFADVLYMAAEIGNTVPYSKEGISVLSPIINNSRLSDWVRVRASVSAARFHFNLLEDAKAASLALLKAHELIPHATSGMSRSDQLQLLEEEFDIPAWTLVLSLSQGTPETSLELLERGRNIFWDGILNKKSVYTSGSAAFGPESGVYQTLRRLSVSSTPGESLKIRPGDIFQDAQNSSISPKADGQDGPVVFINVHALRSDALILTNCTILRLALPELKEADCISYYHQYIKAQSMLTDEDSKVSASELMSDIFRWLWETAARDILEVLGIHDRLPDDLASPRRIWWVTTKWMSVLPIHAAGNYAASVSAKPNSVFDRVVSSYVPSLKILRLLRQRSRNFRSLSLEDEAAALMVAMPTTPSLPDLPCAREEVDMVKNGVSSFLRVQELIHPTANTVTTLLKDCTLAHFACHTKIDDRDPSKSQLQLLDWRSDEALTVDRLLDLELPDCQMVYLSSCNSARDWVARETSMHIAAGFLMAGVPNVIGTMWKVQDKMSAKVATEFYRNLDLTESMDSVSNAAVRLHETVRKMREGGAHLVDWAPYIHFGS